MLPVRAQDLEVVGRHRYGTNVHPLDDCVEGKTCGAAKSH